MWNLAIGLEVEGRKKRCGCHDVEDMCGSVGGLVVTL